MVQQPTIEDVAAAAGVGRGTVSRVLNGGSVSAKTRAKVEDAIGRLGYQANTHARSLASGRNNVYAAVLTEPYGELFEDPTFGRMLQGLSSALTGTEISLTLLIATNADERERAIRHLTPGRVDGVVHLTPHIDDPILRSLKPSMPTVLCDDLPITRPNLWTVHIDDLHGGLAGGRHIVQRGCRTVGIVAGPESSRGALQRLEGQRRALGAAYRPDLVIHAAYGSEGGSHAAAQLFEREPGIDAVLCGSDRQALGVLSTISALGRSVPDDVRVVGFDDHTFAATSVPPLTTIRQPIHDVGATAGELLHRLFAGERVESVVLPTKLIVRASA